MAADFAKPNLGNKIKTDVPGIFDILQTLATGALSGTINTPTGALNFYVDGNNNLKIQRLDASGAWVDIPQLKNDADTVDGYHASTSTTKSTIPVRDSNGNLPGSITGNAPTATKAQQLTDVNPVAMGGTGASTAADARTNLGVPPISHASVATTYGVSTDKAYGHAKATGTTPKKDSLAGTVGNETSTFARGDHQHPRAVFFGTCTTALDTPAKVVSIPDFIPSEGAFALIRYIPEATRTVTTKAEDGTETTSTLTLKATSDPLTLSVNAGTALPIRTSGGQVIGTELISGGTYLFVYAGDAYLYAGGTKLANEPAGAVLSDLTKGTAPDTLRAPSIAVYDKTGAEIGTLTLKVGTDNSTSLSLNVHPGTEAGSPTQTGTIEVGYDASGSVYTAAPTPATQDKSTKIATTEYVNDNACMLYGDQTIAGAKTYASPLTCTDLISGKRLTLNNGVNSNLDFCANNVTSGGAYLAGSSMASNTWKQIALLEDAESVATSKAAAWSRDRQMAPDGTKWGFDSDTTYTAPNNGFIRIEDVNRHNTVNTYVLNINGGVAMRVTASGYGSGGQHGGIDVCYPIRGGWTYSVWREAGDSWPNCMEFIRCYF
jgi:hypothetical protein